MKCIAVLMLALAPFASGKRNEVGHAMRRGLRHSTQGFVRALDFKHTLRVCNAYPSDKELSVTKAKEELGAMPYKSCKDITSPLKSGDKLEFGLDGSEVGTFSISDLPQNDATLLLVIYRHDTLSTAVAFESHVFASLANSQIAVIDTYKGDAKANVKIQDIKDAKHSRSEDLRYDSVVAVNPGEYECVLIGSDGEEKSKTGLVAVAKESYVVLRVGVEDKSKAYKQELMAYPQSDAPKSSAESKGPVLGLMLALITAALFGQ